MFQIPTSEIELINSYRSLALTSDVDRILTEIRNEIFVFDQFGKKAFDVDFITEENKPAISKPIMEKIKNEFNVIYNLLDFQNKGLELFDRWYIDGRLFLHKIVDKNKIKNGIQKIIYLDPLKIKKVIEYPKPNEEGVYDLNDVKMYYIFSDVTSVFSTSIKTSRLMIINKDAIAYSDSGIYDLKTGVPLSFLWKMIVPYNNMKMMEEALLVYRVVRSPERRAFYINVGSLSKPKAEQYIKELMAKFKNKLIYDSKTGSIIDKKNVMSMVEDYWLPRRDDGKGTEIQTLPGACLSLDTKIPLLDGRTLTILDIEKELKEGKNLWAYSCNPENGEFAPGLITWAGITRKDEQVMEIVLDNDEKIICTLDHNFPLQNGIKTNAKDLKVGDRLYPLYRKEEKIGNRFYQQLFDNHLKEWKFTHRLVSKFIPFEDKQINGQNVIHHVNFDRMNNNPENLLIMDWNSHQKLHQDKSFTKEQCSIGGKVNANRRKNDPIFNQYMTNIFKEKCLPKSHTRESWDKISIALSGKKKSIVHVEICKENFKKGNVSFVNKLKNDESFYTAWHQKCLDSWTDERRRNASIRCVERNKTLDYSFITKNQKIEFPNLFDYIELLKGYSSIDKMLDVLNLHESFNTCFYNLNKNKTPVNFDMKLTTNLLKKWIKEYNFTNCYDFKQYLKFSNHKIKSIKILDEKQDVGTITIDSNEQYHNWHTFALEAGIYTYNSNLGTIDDVDLFRKKFLESSNIPVGRFKEETSFTFGRTTEISRDEYRFKKFLDRLRKRFIFIFEDLLKTQLILKNIIVDSEWDEIHKHMYWIFSEDNNFVQWKESEVLNLKLESLAAVDPFVGKYFDRKWVMKNVMRMGDDESQDVLENAEKEKDFLSPSDGQENNFTPSSEIKNKETENQEEPETEKESAE